MKYILEVKAHLAKITSRVLGSWSYSYTRRLVWLKSNEGGERRRRVISFTSPDYIRPCGGGVMVRNSSFALR